MVKLGTTVCPLKSRRIPDKLLNWVQLHRVGELLVGLANTGEGGDYSTLRSDHTLFLRLGHILF